MENTENKPHHTEANGHPKPTEDIQMNIETVTPDTEKEGLPNSQENNHKAEKSPVQDAPEKTANAEPSDESTEDREKNPSENDSEEESGITTKEEFEDTESETTEDSAEEAGTENLKNDDSEDDKRNEIETTSP